jgi:hypothetical protein
MGERGVSIAAANGDLSSLATLYESVGLILLPYKRSGRGFPLFATLRGELFLPRDAWQRGH